jgi:hypothetical protein
MKEWSFHQGHISLCHFGGLCFTARFALVDTYIWQVIDKRRFIVKKRLEGLMEVARVGVGVAALFIELLSSKQ